MKQISAPESRSKAIVDRLLEIWESAVRATHTFLKEEDILNIKPEAESALKNIKHLYCFISGGVTEAFVGVQDRKIEMLFVRAESRGKGIGTKLTKYARKYLDAKYVDVNEQNIQAFGFYSSLGFQVIEKSETDRMGRPFPILHLAL